MATLEQIAQAIWRGLDGVGGMDEERDDCDLDLDDLDKSDRIWTMAAAVKVISDKELSAIESSRTKLIAELQDARKTIVELERSLVAAGDCYAARSAIFNIDAALAKASA